MKVIKVQDLKNTDREVHCPNGAFISSRILLNSDGMGYTLTHTFVKKGGPYKWHYKNHLESCFCISGKGILTDLTTGNNFEIEPGVTYVLDQHDPHTFEALEDTILICVFNPPLVGREVHGPDGSYSNDLNKQRSA